MTKPEKPKNPWLSVGGIIGAIVGYYCGIMLLIPIIVAAIVFVIFKKIDAPRLEPFKLAASVILGHAAWMMFGLLAQPGSGLLILPDIALMLIGLIWLLAKPGAGAVWYFTIFEGISILINGINILDHPFGSTGHKALVSHLCLRIFIIASLWGGFKKKKASETPLPALT